MLLGLIDGAAQSKRGHRLENVNRTHLLLVSGTLVLPQKSYESLLGILPHGMPEVKDVKPAVTKDEEDDEDGTGKGKKKKKQKEEEELKRQKELSEEEKQVRLFFGNLFFIYRKVFFIRQCLFNFHFGELG